MPVSTRRPLLWLAAAFAGGALVVEVVGPPAEAALLAFVVLLLVFAWAAGDRGSTAALAASAFSLGAAASGIAQRDYAANPLRRWLATQEAAIVEITGHLEADPAPVGERWRLRLRMSSFRQGEVSRDVAASVQVTVGGDARRPSLLAGDEVVLWTDLFLPRGFATPGAFDAAGYARRDGIHAFGYTKSAALVTPTGRNRAGPVRRAAARIRAAARGVFARLLPAGPERGLVQAMVLGDVSEIDEATREMFRIAGTYHVLALSGTQVAAVALLLVWSLRRFGATPRVTAVAASLAVAFYAEVVGGEVPVVRAALMAAVLLVGRAVDLEADAANLLGLAALILLAQAPGDVADAGFQLSFGATWGLIALTGPIACRLPRLPFRGELALAGSLAAQAAVLPLMAWHFHRLSPLGFLLNAAAVPLSTGVLAAGVLLLVAAPFSSLAAPTVTGAWGLAHALRLSAQAATHVPGADVRVAAPALWLMGAYGVALAALVLGRSRRRAPWVYGLSLLGLVAGPWPSGGDGRLHVTFLDVGQGDAIVLRSPAGRAMLIDAGGLRGSRYDVGASVVAPYLWWAGVRRLDRFVLSHAHYDHAGGAGFVIRHFRPAELWEGPAPARDPEYERYAKEAAGRATRRTLVRGVTTSWDGVQLTVVSPAGRPPAARTRNDDSLVLEVRWGDVSILLTGDIEAAAERALDGRRVDVLKVPHHGSRTSSSAAFLDRLRPRLGIVSVGARNPFGHPEGAVLARYRARGALVLRTDIDGTIAVSTDGRRLSWECFSANSSSFQ